MSHLVANCVPQLQAFDLSGIVNLIADYLARFPTVLSPLFMPTTRLTPFTSADTLIEEWLAAFNAADLPTICALYAPDARLWGTTARNLIDRPAGVRAYFERVFGLHPRPRMVLIERHGRGFGDVAVQSGRYDLELGPRQVLAARFTLVLRREATPGDTADAANTNRAAWRIVEHHSSAVPDAP